MADFGKDDPVAGSGVSQPTARAPGTGAVTFGADDVVSTTAPSLSQGVPNAADRAAVEERARLAREALARFQALSPRSQFLAGGRHVLSSMPFLRHLVDTEGDQEVADMRTGLPGTSRAFGVAGHTIPYVAAGAGIPAFMGAPGFFSTLPRSMALGGAIEGGDTAVGGGSGSEIARDAAAGAAGTIPGYALGRAITPRYPQSAFDTRLDRAAELSRLWRTSPGWTRNARDIADTRGLFGREVGDILHAPHQMPTQTIPSIPRIPGPGNIGLSGLGTYVGHQIGGGDLAAALAGAAGVPTAAHLARGAANAGISRVNRFLRDTGAGQAVSGAAQGYGTNQVLSPEARALLHSLSIPAVTPSLGVGAEAAGISPEMLLSALLAAPSTVVDTLRGRH